MSDIHFEHAAADKYADKFINLIQNQITARGLILNGAIEEFNDFRNLPKSDNTAAAIWDFAFTLLSQAVPLLRLAPYIQKLHENATVALALARQAGLPAQTARVVKTGTKAIQIAGKAAEKINEAKETIGKLEEAAGKIKGEDSAALQPHKSRKPIMELIQELNKASEAWDTATQSELQEYKNRLEGKKPAKQGSLEDYIKGLLPPIPKVFTQFELDQIWTLYLWYLIRMHVQENVTLTETITNWRGGARTKESSFSGLNDNQERRIVDLFGPGTQRGLIFFMPPIIQVEVFYAFAGTQRRTVNKSDPGGMFTKL